MIIIPITILIPITTMIMITIIITIMIIITITIIKVRQDLKMSSNLELRNEQRNTKEKMHKLSAKEISPHLVIKPTFDGIQKVKRNLPPGVARSLVVKTRL